MVAANSVKNSFTIAICMGGKNAKASPGVVVVIKNAHLGIPTLGKDDLLTTSVEVKALPTELGRGDEIFIGFSPKFTSALIDQLILSGDANDAAGTIPVTPLTAISVTGKSALTYGEVTTYSASPIPTDAELGTVTWSVSNPTLASIDSTGTLTTTGSGSFNVIATSGSISRTLAVTVAAQVIPLQSLTIVGDSSLENGSTSQYSVTFNPTSATNIGTTLWAVNDTSKATISASGLLTYVADGTVTVTATNGTVSSTKVVQLTTAAIPLTGLSISGSQALAFGEDSQYSVTFNPANASDIGTTVWSIDDTSIATIDSTGFLTYVSEGTVTVTATNGSVTDTLSVTLAAELNQADPDSTSTTWSEQGNWG
jgi:uncharacterized protein YjdB